MAVGYPRNGFTPSRQPVVDWIRRMPANATVDYPIAKGDAVYSRAGFLGPCSAGQDPSLVGYGVVLAVYNSAGRPFTFATSKIIASGGTGMVDVCFDPNQTYIVRCKASVGPSNIGFNVTIDASGLAINPMLGISGQAVTIPASASQKDLFKLINISPFDEVLGNGKYNGTATGTVGAPNQGVEVRWNNHFLNAPTAGQ